ITFLCQHLLLYTMRRDGKRDYPPNMNYQQTYFKYYKLMNDYFARAGYLASLGDYKADVLLLHPIGTAWGLYKPNLAKHEVNTEINSFQGELDGVIGFLTGQHIDFDLGDEVILARHGKVKAGEIKVAKKGRYNTIVVPPALTWFKSTVKLLEEFLASGGQVVFIGNKPQYIEGVPAGKKWAEILAHKNALTCVTQGEELRKLLVTLPKNKVKVLDAEGKEIVDILVHYRIDGKKHIFFMSNKSRHRAFNASVFFPVTGEAAEYDLFTGKTKLLETELASGGLTSEIKFSAAGSRAVVVDASKEAVFIKKPVFTEVAADKLDSKWKFKRPDPNALTLDFCRFRLDNGDWSAVVPVYKARQKAWEYSGLQPYKGIQPWSIKESKLPCKNYPLEIETSFRVEKKPGKLYFLVETLEKWTLEINGKKVPTKTTAWQYDKCIGKVDILKYVKTGANTLKISGIYDYDIAIEDMYLTGEFGVKRLYGNKYTLAGEPAFLNEGDWGAQGYPFYSGSMLYEKELKLKTDKNSRFVLELNEPRGTLYFISVNGKRTPLISEPWKADITGAVKTGKNKIQIEVVSSRRNTFGPLHHRQGDDVGYVSPPVFVDDENQKTDYVFSPYGLLEGATLIRSTRKNTGDCV
ncbi:MAG: hypothetical protein WCK36_01745, partial [Candidatus Firestonebacteria bacterium]